MIVKKITIRIDYDGDMHRTFESLHPKNAIDALVGLYFDVYQSLRNLL